MLRTFTNHKNGDILSTEMTDQEARDIIKAKLPNDAYAMQLANSRFLSPLQHFWMMKKATDVTKPRTGGVQIGNCSRIITMFESAAKHLQRPKINLMDPEGHGLILSLAPSDGKNAGCVYIKSARREYLGKITPQGEFFPQARCPQTVAPYLRKFAEKPEELAAQYGKVTGNCCFCVRPLSDARSTEVGYGPVCADRYNLAWGSRKAKA